MAGPDGLVYKDIDHQYRTQFGADEQARAVASAYLNQIEAALLHAGDSLRYDPSLYMTVRDNMLTHKFGAIDEVNAVMGEQTVPFVFFTNAQDSSGKYHLSRQSNQTTGVVGQMTIARPPGRFIKNYADQTIITKGGPFE